jgi:hypothetical protein
MTCVREGSAERNVVAYVDNIFNMASIRMDTHTQDKVNIGSKRGRAGS